MLPSLTAPLPVLAQLQAAAPIVQQPTHDPALKIAWCRDVFYLINRSTRASYKTDLLIGPVTIPDSSLARLAHVAVPLVLQLASSHPVPPSQGQKLPRYIAEAIYMRAMLAATGAFPEHVRHNPRTAFRDFQFAAKNGFPRACFRVGRDFENFNDHAHAKKYFERGVRHNVESCLWVRFLSSMSHFLYLRCHVENGDGPSPWPTLSSQKPNTSRCPNSSRSNTRIPNMPSTSLRLRPPPPLRTHRCSPSPSILILSLRLKKFLPSPRSKETPRKSRVSSFRSCAV